MFLDANLTTSAVTFSILNVQTNLSLNQISFGRFTTKPRRKCEMDLFIMQADGKKIVDPNKQNSLSSRFRTELLRPLRVAIVSRGPDTELLVANPVELSGNGRPLVFYDITLALKMLDVCIFSVITDLLMLPTFHCLWSLHNVQISNFIENCLVTHEKTSN